MSEMLERVRQAVEEYRLSPVSEGEVRVALEVLRKPDSEMREALLAGMTNATIADPKVAAWDGLMAWSYMMDAVLGAPARKGE